MKGMIAPQFVEAFLEGGGVEAFLFFFLIVSTVAIIRQRNLFAGSMLLGLFSLLSAGLFTVMDALDVAFTEAAVGAAFTSFLFLATLGLVTQRLTRGEMGTRDPQHERPQPLRLVPLLVVLLTGAALIYGTLDMPAYGDKDAPIHVVQRPYTAEAKKQVGVPNVVTAVLASYRGYDTYGETTVIFVAGVGVLLLLGDRRFRFQRRGLEDVAASASREAKASGRRPPVAPGPEGDRL
ncbi:MAG: DUF4040 domain-containing protein [Acidobacteriota bacterium]